MTVSVPEMHSNNLERHFPQHDTTSVTGEHSQHSTIMTCGEARQVFLQCTIFGASQGCLKISEGGKLLIRAHTIHISECDVCI